MWLSSHACKSNQDEADPYSMRTWLLKNAMVMLMFYIRMTIMQVYILVFISMNSKSIPNIHILARKLWTYSDMFCTKCVSSTVYGFIYIWNEYEACPIMDFKKGV